MRFPVRQRPSEAPPGLLGTARVDRRSRQLVPRLRAGDIAVLDHLDLDRATAQSLVDAEVRAVVNASAMISGRYPNQGPQVLADAGIVMMDQIGPDGLAAIRDGARIRLHDGMVWDGDEPIARGRSLEPGDITRQLDEARHGLVTQLDTLSRNNTEFLRREQDLLLHGEGVPRPATRLAGRPVVVVAEGPDQETELARLKRFIKETDAVLIGVDAGVEAIVAAGHRPDIAVLGTRAGAHPPTDALRACRDVVLRVDRGAGAGADEALERIGLRPLRFETGAGPEDAALILADAGEAGVIVSVGSHATLEEFLDRQRPDQASSYLTRLRVGPRLVDAAVVPQLYSGTVRARHVFLVLLVCVVVVALAIASTPIGHDWVVQLRDQLADLTDNLRGRLS